VTPAGRTGEPAIRDRTAPRGVLAALCVTVTVSYGTLYYAFAVLAPEISRREDWSLTVLTAGLSAASLMAGLLGIPVGRAIQRSGPRQAMTIGAVVGSAGLAGMAAAPFAWLFFVSMLISGVGAAGLFYAPAFAAITHWYGEQRVRALTSLTLVAGFASTIFAPLTTQLNDWLGWRASYAVLAGLLLTTALPTHAVVLSRPWHRDNPTDTRGRSGRDREVLRSRVFRLVAAAGALITIAEYASLVGLVPLLVDRGMSPGAAAWVLGIGGAGQVLGRLFYPWLARAVGVRTRATFIATLVAMPILLLAVAPNSARLLLVLSVAAGLGRGLFTLVSATLVSDVWGPERFAALNGVLSAPLSAAGALGPFAGAAVAAALGGHGPMFAVFGLVALLGAGLMAAALCPAATPTPAATSESAVVR
jgi:MFS family permease